MNNRYTTANAYNDFNQIATCVENWLSKLSEPVLTKNSDIVRQRILQKLVEHGFIPYIKLINANSNISLMTEEIELPTVLDLNGIRINKDVGTFSISFITTLKFILDFSVHWLLVLRAIFVGLLRNSSTFEKVVLIYGVGQESLFINKNDHRFVDYCRQTPINPIRNAKKLFIQSDRYYKSTYDEKFYYVRHPHLAVIENAKLNLLKRFKLLLLHLCMPVIFQILQNMIMEVWLYR